MTHVIVTGGPVDGIGLIGPFETVDEAIDWAEDLGDQPWWVADLAPPLPDPPEVPKIAAPKTQDWDDGPPRPVVDCGCGYSLIWVGGVWEHDAAPYLWGDDHAPDADEPTGPARDHWDKQDEVTDG